MSYRSHGGYVKIIRIIMFCFLVLCSNELLFSMDSTLPPFLDPSQVESLGDLEYSAGDAIFFSELTDQDWQQLDKIAAELEDMLESGSAMAPVPLSGPQRFQSNITVPPSSPEPSLRTSQSKQSYESAERSSNQKFILKEKDGEYYLYSKNLNRCLWSTLECNQGNRDWLWKLKAKITKPKSLKQRQYILNEMVQRIMKTFGSQEK